MTFLTALVICLAILIVATIIAFAAVAFTRAYKTGRKMHEKIMR